MPTKGLIQKINSVSDVLQGSLHCFMNTTKKFKMDDGVSFCVFNLINSPTVFKM